MNTPIDEFDFKRGGKQSEHDDRLAVAVQKCVDRDRPGEFFNTRHHALNKGLHSESITLRRVNSPDFLEYDRGNAILYLVKVLRVSIRSSPHQILFSLLDTVLVKENQQLMLHFLYLQEC